uniref:Uncharacterized protein n=1 Tax=Chelydra serpentina TaxID=8475 RepID=A0A8C3SL28_CHESE
MRGRGRGRPAAIGSQRGRFISFSTWQALVVTELTPAHHSTEKSQGSLTTYRLTETLSWRYRLRRGWSRVSVAQASRNRESLDPTQRSLCSGGGGGGGAGAEPCVSGVRALLAAAVSGCVCCHGRS